MAMMTLDMIWLLIIILLCIIEMSTMEVKSVWFMLSAIISYFLSKGETEFYIQVIVFLVTGVLLLSLFRGITLKKIEKLKKKYKKCKKK